MFKILFFILLLVLTFCLGYHLAKNRVSQSNTKSYKIEFEKESINGKIIKSSYVTKELVSFCDRLGIIIENFKIDDILAGELKVRCTKDQYYLLVQEITDNKYMLSIKNINY